jgi:hypothetical protein
VLIVSSYIHTLHSRFRQTKLDTYIHLSLEMISNEKKLNYKVVNLDENYNFDVKFIFIRVYKKKL